MKKLSVAKGTVENRTKIFETDHASPGDIQANGGVRKYYKITVAGRTFNASTALGKRIVSGQQVVVVLDRSEALMLQDLVTGKIYGFVGPWICITAALATVIFNLFMIPIFLGDTSTRNLTMLLSIDAFFIIILIVSISYFIKERKAKHLLDQHLQ